MGYMVYSACFATPEQNILKKSESSQIIKLHRFSYSPRTGCGLSYEMHWRSLSLKHKIEDDRVQAVLCVVLHAEWRSLERGRNSDGAELGLKGENVVRSFQDQNCGISFHCTWGRISPVGRGGPRTTLNITS